MTKLEDIRVFFGDCRCEVVEVDLDPDTKMLDIHVSVPEHSLKELLETYPQEVKVEEEILNILKLNDIPCSGVAYFKETEVIHVSLLSRIPTIRITELLDIPEKAITPAWRGCFIINVGLI